MVKQLFASFVIVLFVSCLTGCQPLIVEPVASQPPTVQIELQPASGKTLGAAAIFAQISPSVAFIETPTGTGSGVLIEHGYLLSNAHVVWPFEQVRVVFPDGQEYLDVPVHAWDLMADLALIGPLDVALPPVKLVDGSKLAIGSDIYLIGYPAEIETFPQPAITNGILSRLRTWDAIDYTFFQVDAITVGGQSGGIMVTHTGDVVGVSTFYYRSFGLAGSVADTIARINAMLGNPS
ncbi:MAG: trypsin-like peptidase domain-containing protein, partial [Caldilineaceae bacterium]|nr:trypsin-like peptidase domain-containing protein [Caldilineaceae bacterium]